MPKKYRLSRADFLQLSKAGGRRTHGSYVTLVITPLEGGPKTACVISKKIIARAVDRKRVQRQCREALRSHMARIRQPLALVFYGKRTAAAASFANLKEEIETLLAHARVLA